MGRYVVQSRLVETTTQARFRYNFRVVFCESVEVHSSVCHTFTIPPFASILHLLFFTTHYSISKTNTLYTHEKMLSRQIFLPLIAALAATNTAHAAVSDQCKQETQVLNDDGFLNMVQNDLYEIYVTDFNDVCDISISNFECDYKFDGNNKTYVAACEDKGGQVYTRNAQVTCGIDPVAFDYKLGDVPSCIGISCDASTVEWNELNETRVDQLLSDLKVTGCSTKFSGGSHLFPNAFLGVLVTAISFVVGVFFV